MDVQNEILGIAQTYLNKVRKSGPDNVMAICPFHRRSDGSEERSPSFALSLTNGLYLCHACHAKGNLKRLLQDLGVDEQTITMRYGLVLQGASSNLAPKPDAGHQEHLWRGAAIDNSLLGMFEHDIGHLLPDFSPETLKHFDVGWDGWHDRITYPVYDLSGQLVAISGRTVYNDVVPKYKIYSKELERWGLPARDGWDKRSVLWNAYALMPELVHSMPSSSLVVVVEGFKAAMWVWEAGITNVVALLGSYLSWEQQWMLERMGVRPYLFLDNNYAGRNGQLDAAQRLSRAGLNPHIVEYPERLRGDIDAQPDSLLLNEVIDAVKNAPTFTSWAVSELPQWHLEKTEST